MENSGPSYSSSLTGMSTEGQREAPFPAFVPTLFARSVPGKKLDTRAINTLQLTLSKFEYDGALNPAFTEGAFRLELESIEAF